MAEGFKQGFCFVAEISQMKECKHYETTLVCHDKDSNQTVLDFFFFFFQNKIFIELFSLRVTKCPTKERYNLPKTVFESIEIC